MIRPDKELYQYNTKVKILGVDITDQARVDFPTEQNFYLTLQLNTQMIFKSRSTNNLTAMLPLDPHLKSFLDSIKEEIPTEK